MRIRLYGDSGWYSAGEGIEVEMDFNEIASGHGGGPVRLVLV